MMKEYGAEHLRTGFPILYTSQDSVLQLLAHEEAITPSLLYYYCQVIRELVNPLFPIGRIIARPFSGYTPDTFHRTKRRKDFVDHCQNNPFLSSLHKKDVSIFGNRIIRDIFGDDIVHSFPGGNNEELYGNLIQEFKNKPTQQEVLYIIDLEDFDMIYGHRRDPAGYGFALQKLDTSVAELLTMLQSNDLLIITADHGNDPTFPGHTDHTREKVPLLVYSMLDGCQTLGHLEGFYTISNIIQHHFETVDS
jgi:phosphopentomutase